jgi:hypothetical protein
MTEPECQHDKTKTVMLEFGADGRVSQRVFCGRIDDPDTRTICGRIFTEGVFRVVPLEEERRIEFGNQTFIVSIRRWP